MSSSGCIFALSWVDSWVAQHSQCGKKWVRYRGCSVNFTGRSFKIILLGTCIIRGKLIDITKLPNLNGLTQQSSCHNSMWLSSCHGEAGGRALSVLDCHLGTQVFSMTWVFRLLRSCPLCIQLAERERKIMKEFFGGQTWQWGSTILPALHWPALSSWPT